ncbi:MAG: glycosyltransferase family 9 protein [Deltaproteobacteria bacterium HGW-Deltaproteobacteria-18]|nr:MAG: glycosyltransferase family 9 protein [Deltaproteobacteria bacterium HGW-Deltaproteobacteria-18]
MTNLATFEPKRILVCQLRQIGDVLLTTPSIRLLKERYPNAAIDIFTEKKCTPVLENNPHVRRIWALNKKELPNFLAELKFYARIARENYDLIVDFQQLPRCRFVTLMSRAQVRLSYPPPWYNRLLYTHWAKPVPAYSGSYRASILAPLGIAWSGQAPEIFLTEAETAWAREYLAGFGLAAGSFITLDPTHRRTTRLWPARHYGAMIGQVHAARPDLRFLILYGPGEADMAREVLDHCPAPEACVFPDTVIGLRQMAAVQSLARLHVGNCSGPRHFAVAVNTPTLTVLGATSGGWRFPSDDHQDIFEDLPCRPCNENTCSRSDHACLENLPPRRVADRVLEILSARGSS